jgi:hypothetical protein
MFKLRVQGNFSPLADASYLPLACSTWFKPNADNVYEREGGAYNFALTLCSGAYEPHAGFLGDCQIKEGAYLPVFQAYISSNSDIAKTVTGPRRMPDWQGCAAVMVLCNAIFKSGTIK